MIRRIRILRKFCDDRVNREHQILPFLSQVLLGYFVFEADQSDTPGGAIERLGDKGGQYGHAADIVAAVHRHTFAPDALYIRIPFFKLRRSLPPKSLELLLQLLATEAGSRSHATAGRADVSGKAAADISVEADKLTRSSNPDDDHALAAIDFEGDSSHAMGFGQGLETFLDNLWEIAACQRFARQRQLAYDGSIGFFLGVEIDKAFFNQRP